MSDRVLVVGAREYRLHMTFARVALIEERLDRDLFDCKPGDSATDLTTMAYYCTTAYDDGITLQEFQEELSLVPFLTLAEKVNAALEAFLAGPNLPERASEKTPEAPVSKKKELESGGLLDLDTGEVESDEDEPLHKGG